MLQMYLSHNFCTQLLIFKQKFIFNNNTFET